MYLEFSKNSTNKLTPGSYGWEAFFVGNLVFQAAFL